MLRQYQLRSTVGKRVEDSCSHCFEMCLEVDRLRRVIALLTKKKQDVNSCTVGSQTSLSHVVSVGCGTEAVSRITSGSQTNIDMVEIGCITDEQSPIMISQSTSPGDNTPDTSIDVGCGTDDVNMVIHQNGVDMIIEPFVLHKDNLFRSVDIKKLDSDTCYTHAFSNRAVAYYGDYSYDYNGGTHPSQPLSGNPYLSSIISSVRKQLPHIAFNSAMITKYNDGGHFIPFHSDNEPCIVPGSTITTISLGETRVLQFRSSSGLPPRADTSVSLTHGDVLFMSQLSQNLFEHSIPKDSTKNKRISITLRLIQPVRATCDAAIQALVPVQPSNPQVSKATTPTTSSSTASQAMTAGALMIQSSTRSSPESSVPPASTPLNCAPVKSGEATDNGTGNIKTPKTTTVYISSSMFAKLDEKRLASHYQDAIVISHSGANAAGILNRLRSDTKFHSIETSVVTKIVLLCGSNNIDCILRVPKQLREGMVTQNSHDPHDLQDTCRDIEELVKFVHNWAPAADIHLMNILPRESRARNQIISEVNKFVSKLSDTYPYVTILSTEKDRYLFADRLGFRRSCYFSENGEDNIHLNKKGVIRLANHLKFTTHQ